MREVVTGPKHLSEEQILELYRKARAQQIEVRNEHLVKNTDRQFLAGFLDVLIAAGFVFLGDGKIILWFLLLPLLVCARWIPVGLVSLIYYVWVKRGPGIPPLSEDPFATKRKSTNKEKLKKLHWLNKKEGGLQEKEEEVNPYSVSVMRTVAEELTQPLLESASGAEDHLAWQREGVEALLAQTEKLCEEIRASRLKAGDLEGVFNARLTEARETAASLKSELKRIEGSMGDIRNEIDPLRSYISKLKELESATKRLSGIRGQMTRVLGVPADPVVQLEFQQLPARLELAREHLSEISGSLKAYEAAVVEVRNEGA